MRERVPSLGGGHRLVLPRFVLVGAIGFSLQAVTLLTALHVANVHYAIATVLAVEVAIINNFLWHERWTWEHRQLNEHGSLGRFIAFHGANGATSLIGNLSVMAVAVGYLAISPLIAQTAAVILCGLVNFLMADRWIFTEASS